MKIIGLLSFILVVGLGTAHATVVVDEPNNNLVIDNNGEEHDQIGSKQNQDKYSFTLFNFFSTQLKPSSDTTTSPLIDSGELKEESELNSGF